MGRPLNDALVYSLHHDGTEWQFDLREINVQFRVAYALKRAMAAHYGHTRYASQLKVASAIRKLGDFLFARGLSGSHQLPRATVQDFADWLDHESGLGTSAQQILNIVHNLLAWCDRNTPNVLAKGFDLRKPTIRETPDYKPREGLSAPVLRDVLAACYKEIEAIERNQKDVRRLLAGKWTTQQELDLLILIRDLTSLGDGGLLCDIRTTHTAGMSLTRRIRDYGGMRKIGDSLMFTPSCMLPFYLAILAQLSGNPRAVREMEVDCIRSHPIREDIERVVWFKPRSYAEQFIDFPKGKAWQAPDLIRRLLALNAHIRPKTQENERGMLFICYTHQSRRVGLADTGIMDNELRDFLTRNDLPRFLFKDLRPTGAQLVANVRGEPKDAQRLLNHRDSQTTRLYIGTESASQRDDELIHSHQVALARLVRPQEEVESHLGSDANAVTVSRRRYETIFGFGCTDPFAGIAPNSSKGSFCTHFAGCAQCPGAFVVLDDVKVITKLLAASSALNEAKSRAQAEGWWNRYAVMYEPTRLIIDNTLIPAVSPNLLQRARSSPETVRIPFLE